MESIALLYATQDGQTRRIIERIHGCLKEAGVEVRVLELSGVKSWPLKPGELPVVCSPIRYGQHLHQAREFVRRYAPQLRSQPSAMVSVNLTARKASRSGPENNPYLKRFLQRNDWQPRYQAVFAGALEYERYPWWDRLLIRMIMRMTGGPLEGGQRYEFTNWPAVDYFAGQLVEALGEGS
ncbi:menaquinone-dependent protoporphyrinogen IX dehydrogenase [Aestuariirhabdus sp. LZHN29]|uniref:menaquinone-dependent protoporphyrinogen IX dehydrogenase n=1 Tax=Aestuariirhabdus sp. LZHN29 TaxID=3417462 RepID=UPI003CF7157C